MKIVVLLKQTFDTEERVTIENGTIQEDGVKFIINPYDEYAVEEAIRLKEQGDAEVVVVSVGSERSTDALRTALAMGADRAVLIEKEVPWDEYSVSRVLATFIQGESPDIILGGFFSVDNGAGQVAVRVAHLLGIPHVSAITRLSVNESQAIAVRDAEGDSETVEVTLPALFTAQQGLNDPRYPSLPGIMKAKKKPLTTLSLSDLSLSDGDVGTRTQTVEFAKAPARQAGVVVNGPASEQAAQLASRLVPIVKAGQ
jgi:electron transfer flavoprotein beta subunit